MTAPNRVETSRIPCECGKGEFVFYAYKPDGESFKNRPEDIWYEMHIFCDECVNLFQHYKPTLFSRTGEAQRWKIVIAESDRVPENW
jgi:hypothetical protein